MTLWFRFLWLLLTAWFRPRLAVMAPSELRGRVWPTDCDINLHMNNARYLSVMDLGRTDLVIRTGLSKVVAKRRLQAVVGGAQVKWRRSLKPFERYTLTTRSLFWDERWFWLEQRFTTRDGRTAGVAIVRATFLDRNGTVAPADVLASLDDPPAAPAIPDWAAAWAEVDRGMA